ncbi:YecH family metal-binding protein [Vibrio maerlii]|uniref:YecH family metal-binding protein n=1 Tax=Vibrio maerlii TaxID=2231648 RepID=UPI000E3C9875|nr:YecH family metal-binding protein [Vibrio maerlii]
MSTDIHAHKVLNLLREESMTKAELKSRVEAEFGAEVSFRTCKLDGFDFESLVTFFLQREKVIERDGKLNINAERVCSH